MNYCRDCSAEKVGSSLFLVVPLAHSAVGMSLGWTKASVEEVVVEAGKRMAVTLPR